MKKRTKKQLAAIFDLARTLSERQTVSRIKKGECSLDPNLHFNFELFEETMKDENMKISALAD